MGRNRIRRIPRDESGHSRQRGLIQRWDTIRCPWLNRRTEIFKFVYWLAPAKIYRGWARNASGDTAEGIPWIEQGIRDIRATGTVLTVPGYLARKAEALYLADRTSEALEAIKDAEPMAERFEQPAQIRSDLCAPPLGPVQHQNFVGAIDSKPQLLA